MGSQGGGTHMLRHMGMCHNFELVFCMKSLNMGPIFHENILSTINGSDFHNFPGFAILNFFVFLQQNRNKWVLFFQKIPNYGYLFFGKLPLNMGMGLELSKETLNNSKFLVKKTGDEKIGTWFDKRVEAFRESLLDVEVC